MHRLSALVKHHTRFSCFLLSAVLLSCLCLHCMQSKAAEITLVSDTSYVDMTKYTQVLLPTSSTIAFALDPQGLSSMSSNSADTDIITESAGRIVSNGEVNIVNYSYYPLTAKVSLYVTDSGQSDFTDNSADINSGTENKICLTITPSSAKTSVLVNNTNTIMGTLGYKASDIQIPVTGQTSADASTVMFALPGADYDLSKDENKSGDITYNAQRDLSGDYGTATFKIGGTINKNADWSEYIGRNAKSIKLNAVFSYDTITKETYSELTGAENSQVVSGTYNMISDAADLK